MNYSSDPHEIFSDVHCFFSFGGESKVIATSRLQIKTESCLQNLAEKNQQKWEHVCNKYNKLERTLYYMCYLHILFVIINIFLYNCIILLL